MIKAFFYDPIFYRIFEIIKRKDCYRHVNDFFESKCIQLKKSPKAVPLVMIAMAFIFGGFCLFLAQFPIFAREMSSLARWGILVPFFLAFALGFYIYYPERYNRSFITKKAEQISVILLGLVVIFIKYKDTDLYAIIFDYKILKTLGLSLSILVILWVIPAFVMYAYSYVEKNLSAKYVWKMLKGILYTLVTAILLSLWHWINGI